VVLNPFSETVNLPVKSADVQVVNRDDDGTARFVVEIANDGFLNNHA
jgi:hypothetical protein